MRRNHSVEQRGDPITTLFPAKTEHVRCRRGRADDLKGRGEVEILDLVPKEGFALIEAYVDSAGTELWLLQSLIEEAVEQERRVGQLYHQLQLGHVERTKLGAQLLIGLREAHEAPMVCERLSGLVSAFLFFLGDVTDLNNRCMFRGLGDNIVDVVAEIYVRG